MDTIELIKYLGSTVIILGAVYAAYYKLKEDQSITRTIISNFKSEVKSDQAHIIADIERARKDSVSEAARIRSELISSHNELQRMDTAIFNVLTEVKERLNRSDELWHRVDKEVHEHKHRLGVLENFCLPKPPSH